MMSHKRTMLTEIYKYYIKFYEIFVQINNPHKEMIFLLYSYFTRENFL